MKVVRIDAGLDVEVAIVPSMIVGVELAGDGDRSWVQILVPFGQYVPIGQWEHREARAIYEQILKAIEAQQE